MTICFVLKFDEIVTVDKKPSYIGAKTMLYVLSLSSVYIEDLLISSLLISGSLNIVTSIGAAGALLFPVNIEDLYIPSLLKPRPNCICFYFNLF